jgi:glycosyltransferase involved in cell wall biosynthesis
LEDIAGAGGDDDGVAILIPLYNDWTACGLLLPSLDAALGREGRTARIILVDDGSTQPPDDDFPGRSFEAIGRVDILRLRRNLGHQRAIAIGLSYVWEHVPCGALVLMDCDGEDAPADVPRLLAKFEEECGSKIIFAERTRRSESWTFVFFYKLYKLLHIILTGQGVRVGNFSVIPRRRLDSLIVVSELWNHYAASVFKSQQPYDTLPTMRAKRLSGRSRMNFVRLVAHGLSAMSVFGDVIGVRLLVATFGLIIVTVIGLVTTLIIRLATGLSIPGWATYTMGILTVILFQAVMLSIQFSFIILGGRQGTSFLPCRDYAYFVGSSRTAVPSRRPAMPPNSPIARSSPSAGPGKK